MFKFEREESYEDKVKSSLKTKAKMFVYTIAVAKVLSLVVQLLSSNEEKE